jgi:hypothetical protein
MAMWPNARFQAENIGKTGRKIRHGTAECEFQDRCLKPLGHPSLPATSNIYACLAKEKTNLAGQFHHRRACYQVRREPANAAPPRFEMPRACRPPNRPKRPHAMTAETTAGRGRAAPSGASHRSSIDPSGTLRYARP